MSFQQGSNQNAKGNRKRRNIPNRVQRGVLIPKQDNDFFNTIVDEVKFSSGEHRVILAQEILAYIRRKETQKFFQNQCASRVLDNLLPFTNQNHFEFIGNLFAVNNDTFFKDMYASFLVQTMLKTCLHRSAQRFKMPDDVAKWPLMSRCMYNLNTMFGSAHIKFCGEFVMRSAKYVKSNLAELAVHSYGTHVVRTVLNCLVGQDHVTVDAETRGVGSYSQYMLKMRKLCTTPKTWIEHFYEIFEDLTALPNYKEMANDAKLSGVLQCMVKCLAELGDTERIVKFIDVHFGYTPETKEARLQEIFENQPRRSFLESVMAVLAPNAEMFKSLVESLLVGRFKQLSLDKQLKFSAQHAIEHCQDEALFGVIFGELIGSFDELWDSGNLNAIVELAKACRHRFPGKQAELVEALQKTLRCPDAASMFYPLLKLQKFDELDQTPLMIREQGAQILTQLLFFGKTSKPLVDKVVLLDTAEMIKILFDKSGTHLFYSLFHNESIDKDTQEWFMRRLTGHYTDLVCSKFGKRTFMGIYNNASPAYQVLIVYELAQRYNDLRKSHSGQIIINKLAVGAFAAGMKAWQETQVEPDDEAAGSDGESGNEDDESWMNF